MIDGARFETERKRAGLTQEALAERCAARAGGAASYWRFVITRWESGARRPNDRQACTVLGALGYGAGAAAVLEQCRAKLLAGGELGAVVALRTFAESIEKEGR